MTKCHEVNTQGVDEFLGEFPVRYETNIFIYYGDESVTGCTIQKYFTFKLEKIKRSRPSCFPIAATLTVIRRLCNLFPVLPLESKSQLVVTRVINYLFFIFLSIKS